MSWRVVVVTKSAKLEYSMEYLVVRDAESTTKVHLGDISVLLIENTACAITTALMSQLLQHKIKVIFCDEKRNPCGELTAYYGCHDCSQKLKDQLSWTRDAKQLVWTAIVGEKIKNQCWCSARSSPRGQISSAGIWTNWSLGTGPIERAMRPRCILMPFLVPISAAVTTVPPTRH